MTEKLYIQSAATLLERVQRIDVIITALLDLALEFAPNSNVKEYKLNTGQMITETAYRSIDDINASILSYEKIKNIYLNQLNGRVMVLRPAAGLRY